MEKKIKVTMVTRSCMQPEEGFSKHRENEKEFEIIFPSEKAPTHISDKKSPI